jgi:hypothetical protein
VANEVLYSGLGDQRLAEVLSGFVLMSLADRTALQQHPAILYVGDFAGRGSSTIKIPQVGLDGYDLPSQMGEGVSVANTALTDASTTISVARYSKAYEASGLAKLTDSTGIIMDAAMTFARDAVITQGVQLASLIANQTDGFTATVGTSGVDLDLAVHLAGVTTLEIAKAADGPLLALYHPRQWADLRDEFTLAVGGSVQYNAMLQSQGMMLGIGGKGNLLGTDIVTSSYVPTANAAADRAGAIFSRGAVVWGDASIAPEDDPLQMIIAGKILFEKDRSRRADLTAYLQHYYLGVAFGINARGVSVITDA